MQNITLSADEQLIEKARHKAKAHHSSLNAEFRKWLESYADNEREGKKRIRDFEKIMDKLSYVSAGEKKFTREEMNERR